MTDLLPPVHTMIRRPEASRIEAVQFDGTDEMAGQIVRWANNGQSIVATYTTNAVNEQVWRILVNTEDSDEVMIAEKGDWIAKGALGQFYTLPDDIMTATYTNEYTEADAARHLADG